jgi:hypothetical protein
MSKTFAVEEIWKSINERPDSRAVRGLEHQKLVVAGRGKLKFQLQQEFVQNVIRCHA